MAGSSFAAPHPTIANLYPIVTDQFSTPANLILLAYCTGAPDTTTNTYQHGALIIRTDSGTGVNAQYQNTGSIATPVWTLLDTALGGGASALVDTNGNTAVAVGTTTNAVNALTVTNSAAGAVSANAVQLAPTGTDSAISLTIIPKGATGLINIGAATQTGIITVGLATTAATAEVDILNANGTGSTQTVSIAGGTSTTSGGKVVNIANGVPGTSTTNTVAIGSGGTTTGTVGVTIGSVGAAAHTTLIQGGNGTGASAAIKIVPQAAGDISLGGTAHTGATIVTSASANALAVGRQGTTNPGFLVDTSASTQLTGLKVTALGTGAGVNVAVVETGGTNNALTIDAMGSGIITIGTTSTGIIALARGAKKSLVVGSVVTTLNSQNVTPTAAQLIGGYIKHTTQTAGGTFTLDTGTNISSAVSGVAVGDSFSCTLVNNGNQTSTITTAASGTTLFGTAAVAAGKCATMYFNNTGSNAWDVYIVVSA